MSGLADETRWMDATDQAALVAKGEVTPSELLEAAIERIEQSNSSLNAVVIEWFDHARSVAADPDLPDGPFRGVPFLLKDLYTSFAGQTLSNGNVALKEAGKIDPADTTLVSRFKAAGLVIAGRTNTPEMGSLPTTQPVAWGATRNPWGLDGCPLMLNGGVNAANRPARRIGAVGCSGLFSNSAGHCSSGGRTAGTCCSRRRWPSRRRCWRRSACLCTATPRALPIGIQLAAAYGREDVLIRVASQLESAHPWSSDHPAIT